ncbi:MAG: GNAT family N-acetyltransferase [Chloroflexota bacterium]
MINYTIRKATLDDAEIILHHRMGMFTDMGVDPARVATIEASFRAWISQEFSAGRFETWFACAEDGQVIAGAGLWLYPWLPSPLASEMVRAYILNVYTEREYRQQGIARRLIEEILAYCRAKGFHTVLLHASQQGRPIYDALGFVATNEMRLDL